MKKQLIMIGAAAIGAFGAMADKTVSPSEHPATQWGRIAYGVKRSGMSDNSWRNIALSEYAAMGEGDTANLNGEKTPWQQTNLAWSQIRFDGWFQVSADKAGTWSINQKFDDYFAFYIDGDNVLYNNGYSSEANATVTVSEGWHRFTIIAGDTYGGYGSNKDYGGSIGRVPFTITIGGTAYAFNTTNFPQGSGANTYTLSADADWSADGAVILTSGATLDLNGHSLTVSSIDCDNYIGAMITNTSATTATICFASTSDKTAAVDSGLIKGDNITLSVSGTVNVITPDKIWYVSDPESGKIFELTMIPVGGETLTLQTGQTLDFDANAQINLGPNGTNMIADAFTTDGGLAVNSVGGGNWTWTTSNRGLKSQSFETLFEDVWLGAIEPVSATGVSYMNNNGGRAPVPFFVTRGKDNDGAWMRFELQSLANGYVRAIYVELKQIENNVAGKILAGGWQTDGTSFYGKHMFIDNGTTVSVVPGIASYTGYYAADTTGNGFGISSLTVKARSRLKLPVSGTLDWTAPLSGANAEVIFEAASASAATLNLKAASTMTDSALIVNGPNTPASGFNITCYVKDNALPTGKTELYGSAKMVFDTRPSANSGWGEGISGGNSAITAHPGSQISVKSWDVFKYDKQSIVLDNATLEVADTRDYINNLVLLNGATITKGTRENDLPRVGMKANYCKWTISGAGASTAKGINLMGASNTYTEMTIDVEDVASGSDFIMNGNINADAGYYNAALKKIGVGTMEINGTITYTTNATRIVEGTLLLNKSGAVAADGKLSLEGGTLALAAGTANTAALIAVTAPSALVVPTGVTLNLASLTLGEDATLDITGDGAIGGVKVSSTLSNATLEKIRLNGKRAIQSSSNGALYRQGFIIAVF